MLKIKKGDTVQIISGKDKGKIGKVLLIQKKKERVFVEDINFQTKHQKPRQKGQPGKIIKKEGSIHYSNILLYSNSSKKGERIKTIVDKEKKSKVIIFAKSKDPVRK